MNKKLILLLSIPLILTSCQAKNKEIPSGEPLPEPEVQIIDNNNIKTIYGASSIELLATTENSNGQVSWSSSDETVATVNNGVVSFLDINEKKEVKIKASLQEGVFDEVTYMVNPNPLDIENITGYNPSSFYDGLSITGNEKLLFRKEASSSFFYKASFKSVLKTGAGWFGFYLYNSSSSVSDALVKIKVEGKPIFKVNGYPYLYMEKGDEETRVALPFDAAFKEDSFSDLGIAKIDSDLYIYGNGGESYQCVEHFFDAFESADTYKVGIFTENFDVTVKDFDVSDDAALFDEPTKIFLQETSTTIHVEDQYRLQVRGDRLNIDPAKLTFASSNTAVATVNTKGVVEALADGDVKITAKYDNSIEASVNIHVDPKIIIMAFKLDKNNAPTTYSNDVSIEDTLGNPIKWNYVGASASANNHMALEAGGYIQNVDKLGNIHNFKIKGSGTFKLHTGYEGYTNVKTFVLDGEQTIDLQNVSYFKLEAVTAAIVEVLYGEINDQTTEVPVWTKGATSEPLYDTEHWNRLIHDVDTSKDFTYTLTLRQDTEVASRTSRPQFFVYPASYEDDDSITCTNDDYKYFNGGGYYKIRQDNFQNCHPQGQGTASSETGICKAGAWIDNTITGKATSQEGYMGGGTTPMARLSRHATVQVTFKLENKYKEDNTRYQEWTVSMVVNSSSVVENVDYSLNNPYYQTYKLTSSSGNIFPCERIGIVVGLGKWSGDFTMVSATSVGVR